MRLPSSCDFKEVSGKGTQRRESPEGMAEAYAGGTSVGGLGGHVSGQHQYGAMKDARTVKVVVM